MADVTMKMNVQGVWEPTPIDEDKVYSVRMKGDLMLWLLANIPMQTGQGDIPAGWVRLDFAIRTATPRGPMPIPTEILDKMISDYDYVVSQADLCPTERAINERTLSALRYVRDRYDHIFPSVQLMDGTIIPLVND